MSALLNLSRAFSLSLYLSRRSPCHTSAQNSCEQRRGGHTWACPYAPECPGPAPPVCLWQAAQQGYARRSSPLAGAGGGIRPRLSERVLSRSPPAYEPRTSSEHRMVGTCPAASYLRTLSPNAILIEGTFLVVGTSIKFCDTNQGNRKRTNQYFHGDPSPVLRAVKPFLEQFCGN